MKNIISILLLLGFHSWVAAASVQTKPADQCSEAVLITDDIKLPVLIKRVAPEFEKDKTDRERAGSPIIAEAVITKEGTVACAKIIRSAHPDFNQAIIDALQKWKYKPALKKGKPIAVRFTVTTTIDVR